MTGTDPAPATGRTLAALVREHGTVAPAETMRILAEAADVLEFAHGKRLAHRDLTADSIRVEPNGAVRLTGLAVGDGNTAAETVAINADAEFTQDDADADIHALAAVGYLCLTGRQLDRSAPQPFPPHVPPVVGHPLWLALGIQPDTRTPGAARFANLCRGAIAGLGITAPLRPAAAPQPAQSPSGQLPPDAQSPSGAPPPGAPAASGPPATAGAHTPSGPPPPGAPAAPKRQRYLLLAGGVTAAVAVLVAVVLLAVLQPWARGSQALAGPDGDGDSKLASSSAEAGNSASRSEADKSKSSSASPSDPDSGDAGGGDDDGDTGGGDDGGGGGDDGGGGEDDPYSGPMPDVVGMTVEQAYGAIVSEAWIQTDVNYSSSDPTCIVHTQRPAPGTHLDEDSNPGITADGSPGDCGF